MNPIAGLKARPKILIVLAIGAFAIVALFLSTQMSSGQDVLSEAVEGGELTLTSVGMNHESLTQYVQNDGAKAKQLLDAARVTLDRANAKLGSAKRTSDDYLLNMIDNYQKVAEASGVMAQGVDNLLAIKENITNAITYYMERDYEKAADQALYCLQILTPLLSDFDRSAASLKDINVFYIPSGHRDQLTIRVGQYENEMKTYNEYVLLLESLIRGKEYLQKNALIEEYLRQLQNAVSNKDYQTAEEIRQKISEILQSLRDPKYQSAADVASRLDPSLLSGAPSDLAQELKDRLRNLEGIDEFQNYLKSLQKYLEASRSVEEGDLPAAEQTINEGFGILGQGKGGDRELQGLYEGLRQAFSSLQLHIKGQPPQG